jgi:hypothetical protein
MEQGQAVYNFKFKFVNKYKLNIFMSSDLKKNRKNSRRTPNTQEPKLVERLIKISRVSK